MVKWQKKPGSSKDALEELSFDVLDAESSKAIPEDLPEGEFSSSGEVGSAGMGERATNPLRARRSGDPLVRALGVTIALIIVLTLVTVVYSLVTGVFGTGAPKSPAEQRMVVAGSKVDAGSTTADDWNTYILALISDKQYRRAQEYIDKGTAVLPDQEMSADMVFMKAELELAQGNLDKSIESAGIGLKTIKDTYEREKANSAVSGQPSKAVAFGISENYWQLLLLRADIYVQQDKLPEALADYDEYLADKTTAATVFTQRGQIREKLGDAAGAEADYRRTLIFISNDADALAGLKRIGAN